MTEYQTALAIWKDDEEIEKDFVIEPDVKREYSTPDETYVVYYWYWTAQPFNEDILEDIRHAIIQFDENNEVYYDFVSYDERGCDEEFDEIFDWQLWIRVSFDDKPINKDFL